MNAPSKNKLAEKLAEVRQRSTPPDPTSTNTGRSSGATTADRAPTVAAAPYRRRAAQPSWEERVKRATFYIDRTLLDDLDRACGAHGLSKSEFVRDALQRHLRRINRKP